MTRINVIPVEELADQHLLAEYRELPRALKQNVSIDGASSTYILGPGHVKWARRHWNFTYNRFKQICDEMAYRGFYAAFNPENLIHFFRDLTRQIPDGSYIVNNDDILLNRQRIIERINERQGFYKWTKRKCPSWVENKLKPKN